MKASMLHLSRADCAALKITDPYSIHRVVYSLFPQKEGKTRDFLFVDLGGDFFGRNILVLSKDFPLTLEHGSLQTKDIPTAFLEKSLYGFEVLVNPVQRDMQSGKIKPIRGKEPLKEWFCTKAPSYGFTIFSESLSVFDTDILQFKKGDKTITLGKARFKGKLMVSDRELFKKSFEKGIGRAKGFGFGLLQLQPLEHSADNV